MKKYNIIAISMLVSICFLYLGFFVIYEYAQSAKFKYLSDDTLVVVNSTAFKQSEKEKISSIDGIDQVKFFSKLSRSLKSIGNSDNVIVQFEVTEIPRELIGYIDIELTSGEMATADNQLLISQTLADTLVANDFIDQSVVGQKININGVYTIVGTYNDPRGLSKTKIVEDDEIAENGQPLNYEIILNGAAIGFEYKPLDVSSGISNFNQSQIYSRNNLENETLQENLVEVYNDYDMLVAAGATGLINPDSNYGESFDTLGFVKLHDNADRDYVIDQIITQDDEVIVLSNDSSLYQYEKTGLKFTMLVLTSILIVLVYCFPLFLKKKN